VKGAVIIDEQQVARQQPDLDCGIGGAFAQFIQGRPGRVVQA
jgi:hypothetical protein